MCGIAGLVDFAGLDSGTLPERLQRTLDRLTPRGPDDRGVWQDDHCALAHTRLAVIDLTAGGHQPMAGHGRVVTYNGEIYNFAELRRELAARGHAFASRSDTEVLLAGWAEWGPALLDRLNGMFAFALWDADRRQLIIARDRFGKKPLVFRHDGARLAFASDIVALRHIAGCGVAIDPTALRLLFRLKYIPEPWTIASGVQKLPAGHMATMTAQGMAVHRWYDLPRHTPRPYADEQTAAADLREQFDAAVGDRLVADVPIGAFLSGGIDSALVAAALVRRGGPLRTFTVGFAGASAYYEERPQARAVAAHLGLDHTEIEVGPDEARAVIDQVLDACDEPFADSSAIPTFILSRETRRHVTVALSGDGADEVFGGYRKHLGEGAAARYATLPRWLREMVIEPAAAHLPEGKDSAWRERARRLRRFLDHASKDAAARHAGWASTLGEGELDRLFTRAVAPGATTVESLVAMFEAQAGGDDGINAMLSADIALVLPGDMLVKVDRMSMAHGLEVRCPFLDHRVVECAAAMPGSFKIGSGQGKRILRGGEGKRILRTAFADRLPAEVFERPKKGFEVPIARWLTTELRDMTRNAVDPRRLTEQGIVRPDLPAQWLADLTSGRRDTAWALWTLVVFQAWADRNGNPEIATQ
ncbi:MAG: asparagine synthase (glutamine-hydrolyzing) [Rhodospirillales bacterium]|nr:asparagine synthase (glutamine-hydrolyzing) [Rhodospirillales bacterium]